MKIIYNNTSLDIEVNDNSYRHRAIKGEHNLTLYFSLPQHIELPVGAYCEFEAETYTLETPENFKMKNSRDFEYTVVFESSQAKARKYKFQNPVDRRLKFNLTTTPRQHLQMFIDNMNLRDSGWSIGSCIDAPEKLISYNHAFCMDALIQQAEAFETEYEFIGKQVSLRKVEYNQENPLPLSYGRGKGFKPGVGRTNFSDSKTIEILFVQGGERNIDATKNRSQELLLPKSQTLRYDGKYFEDQQGFNTSDARTYISDAEGLSIQRHDKPLRSREEDSLDLSQIYPSRVGVVTDAVVVNAGKSFYDLIDSTIPQNLDFAKYVIAGESMSVIFQSGMLAGKEFEVNYYHEAKTVNGVEKAGRRFEIVPQEIDGQTMPNEPFAPQPGNKYAVFGIALPDAYVCDNASRSGASWELFREAAKYLYENEQPKFTFTGELDGIWAKKDWLNIGGRIKLGGYVLFSDAQFQPQGVGIRIVGIKDYINNPHSPEIELSNSVVGSSIRSEIRKIESNEVAADKLHKEALQFTKRRFRNSQETITALKEAVDANFTKFSDSISPITVNTMSMLVGDEGLQFVFVAGLSSTDEVPHQVTYNQQAKQLTISAGFLQHKTLGIDSLSSSHAASEYKTWEIPAHQSAVLTDDTQKYYLYARVSQQTQEGGFRISPTPIGTESESGFYHLLLGILGSEFEGEREYLSLHGYTEILPGRITTDRIVSSDGQTYFDLAQGCIGGRIAFDAGSSGLKNLDEWPNVDKQLSALEKDKDAIAYSIGYTDYQDMLAKIGPERNNTIISGGLIRTAIIDVESLYAKNIRTAISGKRVEILGQDKRISVFDDPDPNTNKLSEERVRISGDTTQNFMPPESETTHLTTPAVSMDHKRSELILDGLHTSKIYQDYKSQLLCEFEYHENDYIDIREIKFNNSIQVTDQFGRNLSVNTTAKISLSKYDDKQKRWVHVETLNSITTSAPRETKTYTLLSARQFPNTYGDGRFAIDVSISSSANLFAMGDDVRDGYVQFSYNLTIPSITIDMSKSAGTYSALYSNGLVSYWGGSKYFGVLQLPNNDFIRAIDGRYGFKLNQDKGFLVSTNANSKSPTWNMPMNCVLMGEINGNDGTTKGIRSSSSDLKFKSVKGVIAGEYIITFLDNKGDKSSYFSEHTDYVVAIMPKSNTISGYGLFEPFGKTSSEFKIHTQSWAHNTTNMDFVFFVIDTRNWTL